MTILDKDNPPRAGERGTGTGGRRVAAVAGAVAVLIAAAATPALGVRSRVASLLRTRDDPHSAAASGRATPVVHLRLTNLPGKQLVLWQAPSRSGGVCEFTDVAAVGQAPEATANGGGVCATGQGPVHADVPLTVNIGWSRVSAGGLAVLLDGHISPGTAKVLLREPEGTKELPTHGGYFLGELTATAPDFGHLPAKADVYELVSYNAAGDEVGEINLLHVIAMATPG